MGLYEQIQTERVSKLALRAPVVVQNNSTVRETVKAMGYSKLGCAIVPSRKREPQRLFRESDLTRLLSHNSESVNEPIARFVKKDWPTVQLTDPIERVLDALEEGRLVGVFSDRNVLEKDALEFEQVKDRPDSEVVFKGPVFVYESDSAAVALTVMVGNGFRHVPVTDVKRKALGIISPQGVTAFLRKHLDC